MIPLSATGKADVGTRRMRAPDSKTLPAVLSWARLNQNRSRSKAITVPPPVIGGSKAGAAGSTYFYPVTAIMVVLLALLNDLPIMMIAYDNAPIAVRPVRWDVTRVLTIASVLGGYGVIESFGLYWIVRDYLALPHPVIQALIFLKLLVSGHMTIYLTRNKGPVWERPWPSWKLVVPCEATQLVGTLVVVYGWFMAPTGWTLALMVWAYTLVSFMVASVIKIGTYQLLNHHPRHARHLARIERHVAA
jgi:H+-transporting ATPase